jgi:hypothetical protein
LPWQRSSLGTVGKNALRFSNYLADIAVQQRLRAAPFENFYRFSQTDD